MELALVGIALIFIGFFILMLSLFLRAKSKAEGGFVVFVGPIPIVGATSKGMFYAMLALSIFLLLFSLLLIYHG